ncbi:hypothetical protein F2Q68_00013387 [Brassica cretica]|uniref:Uncharacterized protein n=2 Tax=Brassica cretica TaxID=69181 RepID=A0ABQ7F6T5_BRACR|nr:hypothetical protein F2Q68_00013387 [Brassica cretica]KAF3610729.1 hypothetical protein DY000_02045296 [Brassica cretica]
MLVVSNLPKPAQSGHKTHSQMLPPVLKENFRQEIESKQQEEGEGRGEKH